MLEQFLLDGVSVEPGDRAQPTGEGGAGSAAGLHVAAAAFDVPASRLEQMQFMLLAPRGENPQVQCVGIAGQAAVPGQEADQRDPLAGVNSGSTGTTMSVEGTVVVMANSGTQARARRPRSVDAPASV